MIFDSKYILEMSKVFNEYSTDRSKYAEFSIEAPNGFADPPVIEIMRAMAESDDIEYQERITKFCIIGKQITIKLDGRVIGNIILNSLNDKWEAFKVFVDYPLAFYTLKEICMAYITKKLLPPRKNMQTIPAEGNKAY